MENPQSWQTRGKSSVWFGSVNMCTACLIIHTTGAPSEMFPALISSNRSDCSLQKINLIFCQSCCQLLKMWSLSLFHTHFFPPSLSHSCFRLWLIKMERKGFAVSNSGELIVEVNYRVQWITQRTFQLVVLKKKKKWYQQMSNLLNWLKLIDYSNNTGVGSMANNESMKKWE